MRHGMTMRVRGFTLLELLVVISIVLLLLAIALPALGKAHAAANALICANHQRQLGMATAAYLNDFEQTYPQPIQEGHYTAEYGFDADEKFRDCWFNSLDYYLGQPPKGYIHAADRNNAAIKQDPAWLSLSVDARPYNHTIKMNQNFGEWLSKAIVKWTREADVPIPTRTVLFGDGRAQDDSAESALGIPGYFHLNERYIGLRHDHAANIQFVDGHGQRVREAINSDEIYEQWYEEPDPRQILIWDFDK